jgi:hypothetical protein
MNQIGDAGMTSPIDYQLLRARRARAIRYLPPLSHQKYIADDG